MTAPSLTLQPVDGPAFDRIEAVLAANDLPTADVRTAPGTFFVGVDGDELVGIGGVEVHDSDGLLRSVVVTEPHRGTGYGTVLCDALEGHARSVGVTTLYLLTTTAVGFFRRCGYREIDRRDAPPGIRRTAEFESLCDESATCMRKHL